MPGHIYFGNDVDVALCCIVYNVFDFFLGVETSVDGVAVVDVYKTWIDGESGIFLCHFHAVAVLAVEFAPCAYFG